MVAEVEEEEEKVVVVEEMVVVMVVVVVVVVVAVSERYHQNQMSCFKNERDKKPRNEIACTTFECSHEVSTLP